MRLVLKWKKNEKIFSLGVLEKKDNNFIFTINEQQIKDAIKHGCSGIGNFDFLKNVYVSENLFDFFKFRIPSKTHRDIEKILKDYNLEEYDEMQLLKITKAKEATDNYYVEEE